MKLAKLFIKFLIAVVLLIAGVIVAGVSGLTFVAWPTGLHDAPLSITPVAIQRLHDLQAEHKFDPDIATFYPGARSEEQRAAAQAVVDTTIQSLITDLPARPRRSTVLRAMKATLAHVDTSESEERDQILLYLTRVLDICGVESSGELFNVWRYGFPYGWLF